MLVLCLAALCAVPQAAQAMWYKNCATSGDTSWYNSAKGSFTIRNASQLVGFAELVTLQGKSFKGKTVKLANDINLASVCHKGGQSWLPIGHCSYAAGGGTYPAFSGTFDGQGHKVEGLYIDLDMYGLGFFGYVHGAVVKNLTVSGSVTGTHDVAGVISYCSDSDLSNITSKVSVKGTDSRATGSYAGGVVGYSMTTYGMDRSYSGLKNEGSVELNGKGGSLGGVIGFLGTDSTKVDVSECQNSGNVTFNGGQSSSSPDIAAGGIVGSTTGEFGSFNISACLNTGTVDAVGLNSVGGIAGYYGGNDSTIAGCYNSGKVAGSGNAGGVAGYLGSQGGSIERTYNIGEVSGANAAGILGNASNAQQSLSSNFSAAVLSGSAKNAYGSKVGASNQGTSLSDSQLKSQELLEILNGSGGKIFDWDDPSKTKNPANGGYIYFKWLGLTKGTREAGDKGSGGNKIDNTGGSDKKSQKGKGSGVKGKGLDDYNRFDAGGSAEKIDTSKLTALSTKGSKAGATSKSANSAKGSKDKGKDKSKVEERTSTAQAVKVALSTPNQLEKEDDSTDAQGVLGASSNLLAWFAAACAVLGLLHEFLRFKRLQPARAAIGRQRPC